MQKEDSYTSIRVKISTKEALRNAGDMGESYDKVINRLLKKQKKEFGGNGKRSSKSTRK